jgi:DNA (cytosine-5)-methyltransferase 1
MNEQEDIHNNTKTATIQFCGAGGTTLAAQQAGIDVEAAINHSEIAIASHAANHPATLHYRQSMEECNPDDMPDSDFLLTSPCCTNHSVAKGQKQYHQFDLFGDIVYDPLAERSRNTMHDVVRFVAAKKRAGKPYTFVVVENVVDVVKWRQYSAWLVALTALGYQHQALYWNTRFFEIPQSRDRVYLLFWLRDVPTPDLEYCPLAWCAGCQCEVRALQSWKRQKWGRYQQQYVYRCAFCAREVPPYSRSVRSVLNAQTTGRAIGERKLSENTRANIRAGLHRMGGDPFLLGYYKHPLYRRLDEPIGTITTLDRWALVTPASSGLFEACRMRMLSVQEVKACMGFPESYHLDGTEKQQKWLLGNAVCPPIEADILTRCLAVFAEPRQEKEVLV